MPFSIHTARWINQLNRSGWEVHLFPSMNYQPVHEALRDVTYHANRFNVPNLPQLDKIVVRPINQAGRWWFKNKKLNLYYGKLIRLFGWESSELVSLLKVIDTVKPDIIHSLETQHGAEKVLAGKKICGAKFPTWLHSTWGIDLHFFGKLAEHRKKLQEIMEVIDGLIVEGARDEKLARGLGYRHEVHTFPSVGGGFQLHDGAVPLPSRRKKILVKGMQDKVRRGLVALRALERCVDVLDGYELILYSANDVTRTAASLFQFNTGKEITILDTVSHEAMIRANADARISICINMSDGVPNSMLEAMMMGAFPIQSNTAITDEWIDHGVNGLVVPPEDPEIVEKAIRQALSDDALVDAAAAINRNKMKAVLDVAVIQPKVLGFYQEVYTKRKTI